MTSSRGQSEFATHKECVHFRNGFCTLNGVEVDPNQAACPNFAPKDTMTTLDAAKAYQQPGQLLPISLPPRQGLLVRPDYPQNYSYTNFPHPRRSYLLPQRGYGVPRRGTVFSMSSGRGTGRGRSGRGGGKGRGRGRMGGFAAGPGGSCVCPSCGYTVPHKPGSPCFQQTCPKCGTRMTRAS